MVSVDGLNLHFLEIGTGPPVLLLHGWPTSSALWRNVMLPMAGNNRVIALDLPGFGQSDKPLEASYSFRFYQRVLDRFIEQLEIDQLGLAVHDLGGPVGLYWACQKPERINKLALLNTLVYPEVSWAVVAFGLACRLPGLRSYITSRHGLRAAMRLGVEDKSRITDEVVQGIHTPFIERDARRALCKTALGLSPKGLQDIARLLPQFKIPVRIVYGERDRILPDVAKTMARVKQDLPQAEVTALAGCGHFLQEDQPEHIGQLLNEFFAP